MIVFQHDENDPIEHTSASVVGSSPLNGLCSEDDDDLCIKYWLILIGKCYHWHENKNLNRSEAKLFGTRLKIQFVITNLKEKY
jgi:hypothetical protein